MSERRGEAALAPDAAALADEARSWRSAYVHLPFCRRRCPYCDFAVVAADEVGDTIHDTYLGAVLAEIEMEAEWGPLHAVNFGGGTPSQTKPVWLGRVLSALEHRFGFAPGVEISLEANPEDWSAELAARLVEVGFTRVSLGVQSFDQDVLGFLGRIHTPEQARAAVSAAVASEFASVGVDLIFGSPGESIDSWLSSVTKAVGLGIHHLSTYALTVEPGTALSRSVRAGAAGPEADDQADKYEIAAEVARGAGLVRYEVSNFARPGHVCRYNLGTWGQGEYLAFGLGANDHRDGLRSRGYRKLERYLEAVAAGERPHASSERLGAWGREQERLVIGLRRAAGALLGDGGEAFVSDPEGKRLLDAGVVSVRAGRLVVDKPLLTDAVARCVLSLSP